MTKTTIAGGALATVLVFLVLAFGNRAIERNSTPAAPAAPDTTSGSTGTHAGLLYGRVTTEDGTTYDGRLRWGADEEALWGHYFNGFKDENPWIAQMSAEQLPKERTSLGAFGIEIVGWDRQPNLGRPFMARFGDITRIEKRDNDVRVTLKSGTTFDLDRLAADDLADGLRVWDEDGRVVDLVERQIHAVELLPAPNRGSAPRPLHGTVRTTQGDFTGLVQWNRQACVVDDELFGYTTDGELSLRFDGIASIARHSRDSSLVTLHDGREIVLSGTREVGRGNRGIYVDDQRYGRVLISWEVFERLDFSVGGTGPAFADFPQGGPLTGSVITRAGRRLAGRLVFDLDESEITETLDAPSRGINYMIPFGLIASIVPPNRDGGTEQRARVTLHSGEELQLEANGDLGDGNAGMLVFVQDRPRPEYISWGDVQQIEFQRARVMYPSFSGDR